MTADEIQRRVDAWLAARADWASETARRRFLVGQWRHVCPVFGADSDAALGVLRGLARDAHGDEFLAVTRDEVGWRITGGNDYTGLYRFSGESLALVIALEAAP